MTFTCFADRIGLSKQAWNVMYSDIVHQRNMVVSALLPLIGMYLYFYVTSWRKKKKRAVALDLFNCIMPCVDRGSLSTLSFRGLFKAIRCHVDCY